MDPWSCISNQRAEARLQVQALRALRALRPLRTINRFSNLRAVVAAFIEALPMLGSVVLLAVLALSLWALMGLQLFLSMYHTVCRNDATGEVEVTGTNEFSCGARRCVFAACYPCSALLSGFCALHGQHGANHLSGRLCALPHSC
jgi:hypothetical protein